MQVLVVLIVDVRMLMLHRLVGVRVLMTLGSMEPHAKPHQRCRDSQRDVRSLVKYQQRECGTDEGRRRKVRGGARRPELAQREHEEHETHTVAEEPEGE